MPLRSASCTSCYCAYPDLVFHMNKLLGDESVYYKRRREDESIYLVEEREIRFWRLSSVRNVG